TALVAFRSAPPGRIAGSRTVKPGSTVTNPDTLPMRSATAALAALFAFACGGNEQAAAPQGPPPPEVSVMVVQSQPITNVVEVPGRVQAVRTSEVRARVDGIVERRVYTEGTDVQAG